MRPHGFIFGIFPLVFILAACGGGSSPEAQTSLPQTSRQQQPKLVDPQKPTEKKKFYSRFFGHNFREINFRIIIIEQIGFTNFWSIEINCFFCFHITEQNFVKTS